MQNSYIWECVISWQGSRRIQRHSITAESAGISWLISRNRGTLLFLRFEAPDPNEKDGIGRVSANTMPCRLLMSYWRSCGAAAGSSKYNPKFITVDAVTRASTEPFDASAILAKLETTHLYVFKWSDCGMCPVRRCKHFHEKALASHGPRAQ